MAANVAISNTTGDYPCYIPVSVPCAIPVSQGLSVSDHMLIRDLIQAVNRLAEALEAKKDA